MSKYSAISVYLNSISVKEKVDDSQLRLASAVGFPIRAFATILPILDNIELTGGGIILLRELHRLLTYCIKVIHFWKCKVVNLKVRLHKTGEENNQFQEKFFLGREKS